MTDPSAGPGGPFPQGVIVRVARPEDVLPVVTLFGELDRFQSDWRVFEPRPTLRAEAEGRYRAAIEAEDSRLLVAEEAGEVVGMALGHLGAISSISDEAVLEVENVFVQPSHRRRGVAGALVRALAGFARERAVRQMALKTYASNDDAMRFWESLGFRPRWVQMTAPVENPEPAG